MSTVEAPLHSWYPSPQTLLERPLHNAIAVDPVGSCEVDDAIEIISDSISADNFTARYHIANGALLHGTPHIDSARKKAWSIYDDGGNHDLMLEQPVIDLLSLDRVCSTGVPAVMIQVEFCKEKGTSNVVLGLSRVDTQCVSHSEFEQGYYDGNPDFALLVNAARRIARRKGISVPMGESMAQDMVAAHMIEANATLATALLKENVPILRRVHSDSAYEVWDNDAERRVLASLGVALYDHRPNRHRALRLRHYTHGTSPLRRFADIVTQINTQAFIEGNEPPYKKNDLQEIARELTSIYIKRSVSFAAQKSRLEKKAAPKRITVAA